MKHALTEPLLGVYELSLSIYLSYLGLYVVLFFCSAQTFPAFPASCMMINILLDMISSSEIIISRKIHWRSLG